MKIFVTQKKALWSLMNADIGMTEIAHQSDHSWPLYPLVALFACEGEFNSKVAFTLLGVSIAEVML
jgi:hypothetical protein